MAKSVEIFATLKCLLMLMKGLFQTNAECLQSPHCSLINFHLGTHIDCLEDNVSREIFGLVNVRFFQ